MTDTVTFRRNRSRTGWAIDHEDGRTWGDIGPLFNSEQDARNWWAEHPDNPSSLAGAARQVTDEITVMRRRLHELDQLVRPLAQRHAKLDAATAKLINTFWLAPHHLIDMNSKLDGLMGVVEARVAVDWAEEVQQ